MGIKFKFYIWDHRIKLTLLGLIMGQMGIMVLIWVKWVKYGTKRNIWVKNIKIKNENLIISRDKNEQDALSNQSFLSS